MSENNNQNAQNGKKQPPYWKIVVAVLVALLIYKFCSLGIDAFFTEKMMDLTNQSVNEMMTVPNRTTIDDLGTG